MKKNTGAAEQNVEVLYQKMGDRWFAFSLIDDEVFVGSISQDEIERSLPPNTDDAGAANSEAAYDTRPSAPHPHKPRGNT